LEKVWAAVSQAALNMVFDGGDAVGFEADARFTAMFLWTLKTELADNIISKHDTYEPEDDSDEGGNNAKTGLSLDFDTASKISKGLGINLEELGHSVEIKGDNVRLRPPTERAEYLFGIKEAYPEPVKKKKLGQPDLFGKEEDAFNFEQPMIKIERVGATVLDRLHQAMLLFYNGKTDALRHFLIDEGVGRDERFWKLAQSLNALYPQDSNERRWLEAIQTYKRNLGF
jgi:hypothetical protein